MAYTYQKKNTKFAFIDKLLMPVCNKLKNQDGIQVSTNTK